MAKKKSKKAQPRVAQNITTPSEEAAQQALAAEAKGSEVPCAEGVEGAEGSLQQAKTHLLRKEGSAKSCAADKQPHSSAKVGREDEEDTGTVLRSTLYMAVVLALVVGIYMGTLLPGLMGHNMRSGSASAPTAPAPAASSAEASEQEKNLARLAGHIQELETAVRKNPEDVKSWVQLGNLYFDTGKAPQAVNAYERALLLKPDDADVLTDLGIMYRESSKFELAVQSFRKAIQINPKHQNAIFNSGVVLYYDLKRTEEAHKAWQQLLVVNPKATTPNGKPVKDLLRELK